MKTVDVLFRLCPCGTPTPTTYSGLACPERVELCVYTPCRAAHCIGSSQESGGEQGWRRLARCSVRRGGSLRAGVGRKKGVRSGDIVDVPLADALMSSSE